MEKEYKVKYKIFKYVEDTLISKSINIGNNMYKSIFETKEEAIKAIKESKDSTDIGNVIIVEVLEFYYAI